MNADLKWLTDPEVFRVNRLDAHSDHVCYASEEEAEWECSTLRQSLDGEWGFFWSPRPADRPENFWQEGYDESAFGTIRVPGHMELQGHGQIQYINTLYPWDGHAELRPPEIDWNDNPVGSYVRYFTLEPGLQGKRVCISFQGVEPACPWSHESPSLYAVTLTVRTADGRVQEVIPCEIGFRHLALENGILYLNGRRLVIRGVNRHECNPNTGRVITEDDMTAAMDTGRFRLEMAGGEALQVDALEKPFGFSAIPYTPQQLEQACHVWELPEPCRTVVKVYGAMRGVGGIDSWMTDVEKAYHLPADRDLEFSFLVRL